MYLPKFSKLENLKGIWTYDLIYEWDRKNIPVKNTPVPIKQGKLFRNYQLLMFIGVLIETGQYRVCTTAYIPYQNFKDGDYVEYAVTDCSGKVSFVDDSNFKHIPIVGNAYMRTYLIYGIK